MKALRIVMVSAFLLFGGSLLMAQVVVKADLSGAEEVPPFATNGGGQAVFIVYPDRIEYILTASNLGTEVQAAHIHLGPRGANGPVLLDLYIKAKHGPFTGRITGTLTPADLKPSADRGVSTFEDARRAVTTGRTYTNLHTTLSPGGEIRGQVVPAGQD